MNLKHIGFKRGREGKIWPFASTLNAPHFLLAPEHTFCKSCCVLPSFAHLQQTSSHVRQRSKGPFRLRQRCQGHDGRQEGRQEEACFSVSSCRSAIPCRKDSQTVEGTSTRSWSGKHGFRLLLLLLLWAGWRSNPRLRTASACTYLGQQLTRSCDCRDE